MKKIKLPKTIIIYMLIFAVFNLLQGTYTLLNPQGIIDMFANSGLILEGSGTTMIIGL